MHICRYWTADGSPLTETVVTKGREYVLSRFSEEFLLSAEPSARSQLRSKSRGVVLLCALIRELQKEMPLPASTGVYLFCGFGPCNPKTQEVAMQAPPSERWALIDRALPPKDYFISNQGLKAAQISIEFGLHGPWMAFISPEFGLAQAFHYGQSDLRAQVVEGALIGGIFTFDEPSESAAYFRESTQLSECVWLQYAAQADQIRQFPEGPLGKYGPLTTIIERTQ